MAVSKEEYKNNPEAASVSLGNQFTARWSVGVQRLSRVLQPSKQGILKGRALSPSIFNREE